MEQLKKFPKNLHNHSWYFIKDGKEIRCRSSFEALYANYLIDSKILFEYEPETFCLENDRLYTPDFYLNARNIYVEIKSPITVNDIQMKKIELFRISHRLDILYIADILKLMQSPYNNSSFIYYYSKKLNMRQEDYIANRIYLTVKYKSRKGVVTNKDE